MASNQSLQMQQINSQQSTNPSATHPGSVQASRTTTAAAHATLPPAPTADWQSPTRNRSGCSAYPADAPATPPAATSALRYQPGPDRNAAARADPSPGTRSPPQSGASGQSLPSTTRHNAASR